MAASAARVVIVTGGAAGIGRATAERLAADGFSVAIWDADAENARRAAAAIRARGGVALAGACDITRREQIDAALSELRERLGEPYGLVNNAGVDRPALFCESRPEDWRFVVDVNLLGALNVTHAVLPAMIAAGCGGSVVCISSDAARVGSSAEAVYAATKAGLLGFVKALARETARHRIRVNAVCPGPTDTALLDTLRKAPKGDKIVEGMARAIPLGRIATPPEIAAAIAFFLSDDAGYVTGQTLSVSGGLTMAG